MASKLNPAAPEFVPGIGSYVSDSFMSSASMDDVPEDNITPEELEELEAAEDWVVMQALIEELEQEHLIQVALRYAPEARVNEIHKRFGVKTPKMRSHKGMQIRGNTGSVW